MTHPIIKNITEKKLIGKTIQMSLTNNQTGELWKSFMSGIKEIKNNIGSELYSIAVYNQLYFNNFSPGATFEKWAAIEVADFKTIPEGMETITLKDGLYAVFLYKGAASAASGTFQYIFETWLPGSAYVLDDRPHFEVMGAKYKNEDPDSEEELWIPIRLKK